MELSYQELGDLITQISECVTLKEFNKGSDVLLLEFRQPTNKILIRAKYIYDKSHKEAIDSGLLPTDELEKVIVERNIFTEADQKELEGLEAKIEAQKVLLSKITKVMANKDRISKYINELEAKAFQLRYRKYSTLAFSAESKADEDRNSFLCAMCVYDSDSGERYWKTLDDFFNEPDPEFRTLVLSEYTKFYNGIDVTTIRYIARSNLWRIRYINSCKTNESLFGRPSSMYTNDQLNLVYWSNYYQSIYEMMPEDRPPEHIINDDTALDTYMDDYYKELEKEASFRKGNKTTKGKLSAFDSEEVIVTQFSDIYQDIKYDKPREAARIKDRADIKKRTSRRS